MRGHRNRRKDENFEIKEKVYIPVIVIIINTVIVHLIILQMKEVFYIMFFLAQTNVFFSFNSIMKTSFSVSLHAISFLNHIA